MTERVAHQPPYCHVTWVPSDPMMSVLKSYLKSTLIKWWRGKVTHDDLFDKRVKERKIVQIFLTK